MSVPTPPIFCVGGQKITLTEASYIIGRKENNPIFIKDSQISGRHAELIRREDVWWIQDLKSRNGVYVNEKKVESCRLQNGDIIRLGESRCVFRTSMVENMPRRNSFVQWIIVPIIFLSILGIVWHFWIISEPMSFSNVAYFPDNMLKDFSFEENFAWELATKMSVQNEVARSGQYSLKFTNLQSFATSETYYTQTLRAGYQKAYKISAWIKTEDLVGCAGIKVVWFSEKRKISDQYSELLQGTKDWHKVDFTTMSLPNADEFQIVCFVSGKAKSVYFDDIVCEPTTTDSPWLWKEEYDGLYMFLDTRGILRIHAGTDESCDLGIWEIFDYTQERFMLGTQKISYHMLSETKNTWSGMWFNPENIQNIQTNTLIESPEAGQFTIHYELTLSEELPKALLQYHLWLNKQYISQQESITSNLVWYFPKAKKKFVITFSHPFTWNTHDSGDAIGYTADGNLVPQNCKLQWKLCLQIIPIEDRSQLQQYYIQAVDKRKSGQLGQAYTLYQKIHEGLVPTELESARQEMKQIEKLWQYDQKQVQKFWNQARFFNMIASYQQAIDEITPIAQRWEGYAPSHIFQDTLQQIRYEASRLQELEDSCIIQKFLQMAHNLDKEDNDNLAITIYQHIITTYPKNQSTDVARASLDIMLKKKN